MSYLDEVKIEALIKGATILGTGGGGDPVKGLNLLKKDLREGRKISLIKPSQLKDRDLTICAYIAGSIAPLKESKEKAKVPRISEEVLVRKAVEALEEYIREKAKAILPVEIGGGNTAEAIHVAALLSLPVIDGDLCGRALPEITHSTYYICGVPIIPVSLVDSYGNSIIITQSVNDRWVDRIARSMSITSNGMVGVADHPVNGKLMKSSIIPNTLSKCIKIGEVVASKKDVIKKIISTFKGYFLFKGKARAKEWEDKGGFMYGTTLIEGKDRFAGAELKIWFKNENLIAWKNEKAIAMAPDLICLLNSLTSEGITNDKLEKDMEVSVIGIKTPPIWRSKKGLEILSPKYFGFKEKYVPIEKLNL
jgi:hypothetical protein